MKLRILLTPSFARRTLTANRAFFLLPFARPTLDTNHAFFWGQIVKFAEAALKATERYIVQLQMSKQ
jgi:hypothetical protein